MVEDDIQSNIGLKNDTACSEIGLCLRGSFPKRVISNWLIMDPNLMADKPQKIKKRVRNYQVRHSDNIKFIYFFGGRLRTAKAKPIQIITVTLIMVGAVLYWIFEASWQARHISPVITVLFTYLWIIMVSSYMRTATSDPGIISRNLHIPSSVINFKLLSTPDEYLNEITLPYFEDKTKGVNLKYCPTCHIWRLPKTSHCSVCNSCIQNHDHHCTYINNCVGIRNYKYFLWFIFTANACCTYVVVTSFVHLFHYRIASHSHIESFKESVSKYPMSLFLTIYGLLTLIYPCLLLIFHLFLTSQNLSTRDYLNNEVYRKKDDFVNVFNNNSTLKNLYSNWFGVPKVPSNLRPKDTYEQGDIRLEKIDPM